jgi:Mg2+ and Co2+ transporter CorA
MLNRLSGILNETVMGFLALAALSLGLSPFLFELPRGIEQGFDVAQWVIIGLFALEYAANLALSTNRRKFVLDPWHMLDAVIIVAPLLSLLPAASEAVRSTPALRILRLFRMLLFVPRVGHGLERPAAPPPRPALGGKPRVTVLRPGDTAPRKSDWSELLQWAAAPTSDWLHASNLAPERLMEVASALGVPRVMIEGALHESSYPRIESGASWTALTLSLPATGDPIHRDPILMLVTANDVLSLAPHPLDLQQLPAESGALPWGPRCALHIIRLVLVRNEVLAGQLERTLRQLEALPMRERPESFFGQTFRLKRVLSTAKGDLWRLRGLLEMVADGRRQLPGLGPDQRESVTRLAEEADYLYETVDNLRESVLSLIELHIGIAAYQTNRFMRLVAIVSALALIPAIVGGLLGMNLGDAPWPVTLGQVAFGTLMLMLAVLYTFMAKGWLR